jgi:hypothetical protein
VVPVPPHALLRYFDMNPDKEIQLRFGMANLLGLSLTGLLMLAFCRAIGFATLDALIAALFFYLSFPVINFGGTPMVDVWAYAFLMLGLLAAVRGAYGWLLVTSLVGMLAKETTLLLVPAVVLLADTPGRKLRKLFALLPGVLGYAVLRFVLYPGGAGFPSDPWTSWDNLHWRLTHGPYWAWILFDGGTAFGIFAPLAAWGAWRLRNERRNPLLRLGWWCR